MTYKTLMTALLCLISFGGCAQGAREEVSVVTSQVSVGIFDA